MHQHRTAPLLEQSQDTTPHHLLSSTPRAFGPLGTPSYPATLRRPQLSIAIGGQYAKLRQPQQGEPQRREWKRGKVQTFSARSRSRMLQALAMSDLRGYEQRAHFLTFTYHREWGESGRDWKGDLDAIDKRLHRHYPDAWYFWKLEFQERGAPHFHCLMFGPRHVSQSWVRAQWQQTIGTNGYYAWRYGAQVDGLKSWNQVGHYCSKYCAKIDESLQSGEPGRFWGIKRRTNRTVTLRTVEIAEDEFFKIRRIFKRIIRAHGGYHAPGGPRSGVWIRCSNETAKRALDWASSALERPPPKSTTALAVTPYGHARQPGDTWRSNIWSQRDSQPNPSGRMRDKPNIPAFDALDLQRARAARWVL